MFLEGHLEVRNDMTGGQEYTVEVRVDLPGRLNLRGHSTRAYSPRAGLRA